MRIYNTRRSLHHEKAKISTCKSQERFCETRACVFLAKSFLNVSHGNSPILPFNNYKLFTFDIPDISTMFMKFQLSTRMLQFMTWIWFSLLMNGERRVSLRSHANATHEWSDSRQRHQVKCSGNWKQLLEFPPLSSDVVVVAQSYRQCWTLMTVRR